MPLNKQKGNMYGFVTHTVNTVRGACPHNCVYCYMKRWNLPELHFVKAELKTDLGKGNCIFIGSGCDMFANDVCDDWIIETLKWASKFNNNYLVQTKNPSRFMNFLEMMKPSQFTLCTTIETNRHIPEIMSESPSPEERSSWMAKIPNAYRKMVTVEPVIDFSLKELSYQILSCSPKQVNIGADSGNNGLPEPSSEKIRELITVLSRYTEVHKKPNLKRILGENL
jgi:DNA repair photolyase